MWPISISFKLLSMYSSKKIKKLPAVRAIDQRPLRYVSISYLKPTIQMSEISPFYSSLKSRLSTLAVMDNFINLRSFFESRFYSYFFGFSGAVSAFERSVCSKQTWYLSFMKKLLLRMSKILLMTCCGRFIFINPKLIPMLQLLLIQQRSKMGACGIPVYTGSSSLKNGEQFGILKFTSRFSLLKIFLRWPN